MNSVIKDILKHYSNILLSGTMFGLIDIDDVCKRTINIDNWVL